MTPDISDRQFSRPDRFASAHKGTRDNPIFDVARVALARDICVVPPTETGEKRPCPVRLKRDGSPAVSFKWEDRIEARSTEDDIQEWYGPRTGIGFVCGAISGGLELFEFDERETYDRYKEAAVALGLAELVEKIEAGYLEETPGNGVHWLYYCDELRGSTKLAKRPIEGDTKKFKTLIETKGEGGYVVVAPSHGRVHPSGNPYRLIRGGIESIVQITCEEREALWNLGRSFDVSPIVEASKTERMPRHDGSGWRDTVSPGNDFNQRATWEEILTDWTFLYRSGQTVYVRRPGKDLGCSATINHLGTDRLHVFTSSTAFEPETSYSKFGAFAVLNHGGDYKEAARALSALGYGTHKEWVKADNGWTPETFQNPPLPGAKVAKPGKPDPSGRVHASTARDYDAMDDESLGLVKATTVKVTPHVWEWPQRFKRGAMTIIGGAGGQGKSQTTIDFCGRVTVGAPFPDGSGNAEVGNVMILSCEDGVQDTILPRLIAAGADLNRVVINTAEVTETDESGRRCVSTICLQDVDYWEHVLTRCETRVLVIDPLPAYLGNGVDDHRNNEVRRVLIPFGKLIDRLGVTVLAVTHVNKSENKSGVNRIIGSIAYSNFARATYITNEDDAIPGRYYLEHEKVNVGKKQPTLTYTIESVNIERDGVTIETSRIVYDGSPAPVIAGQEKRKPGPAASQQMRLAEWLFDLLLGRDWVPFVEIQDAAGQMGFLGDQLPDGRWPSINPLYRAKDRLAELPAPKDGYGVLDERRPLRGNGKPLVHWKLMAPEGHESPNALTLVGEEEDDDFAENPF